MFNSQSITEDQKLRHEQTKAMASNIHRQYVEALERLAWRAGATEETASEFRLVEQDEAGFHKVLYRGSDPVAWIKLEITGREVSITGDLITHSQQKTENP